jgi:pimeloyl-ACP methyl ester carboxylesterase
MKIRRRSLLTASAAIAVTPVIAAASAAAGSKLRTGSRPAKKATYVLVHGGGHGGWCWQRVTAPLREQGHDVYAPSMTGMADRSHLLNPDINLDTQITDIVNLLKWESLTNVILVGHSYGGMVITGVANRAGSRIAHLVYLDAAHPRNGESLADLTPEMMAMAHGDMRVVDGVELVLFPDSQAIAYLGVTDTEDFAWLKSKITPHPWKCFIQKLRLEDEAAVRRIPRTNINCAVSLQMSTSERRERQLDGNRNFEIDTGHDLMITEPQAVADALLEVAAG